MTPLSRISITICSCSSRPGRPVCSARVAGLTFLLFTPEHVPGAGPPFLRRGQRPVRHMISAVRGSSFSNGAFSPWGKKAPTRGHSGGNFALSYPHDIRVSCSVCHPVQHRYCDFTPSNASEPSRAANAIGRRLNIMCPSSRLRGSQDGGLRPVDAGCCHCALQDSIQPSYV